MGATDYTPLLGLPQFADNDRPTWRGDINGAFADIEADAANFKNKVSTIALGTTTDSFRLTKSSDDATANTAMINAWLADTTLSGKRRLVGYANINDTLTVPDNVWLDGAQATIKQNAIKKTVMKVGSNVRLDGLTILGRPADYEENIIHETTFDTSARGLWLLGDNITLDNITMSGVAHQCFFQSDKRTNIKIRGARVTGVHGMVGASGNPINILYRDAMNNGFLLYGSRHVLEDIVVENLSMGFGLAPIDDLSVRGVRGYNIKGQHLFYFQSGNGLNVSDVVGRDIAIELAKVQIHSPDAVTDHSGVSFSQITGINCGGHVVALTNTDTDLTTSARIRDVTLTGLNGVGVSRISTLINVSNASIENVTARNADEMFSIRASSDISINGYRGSGIKYAPFNVYNALGRDNARITISNGEIRNAGTSGDVRRAAVYVSDATVTDLAINNMRVISDTAPFMQYGVQMVLMDKQETLKLRNIETIGMLNGSVGLIAGKQIGVIQNVPGSIINLPSIMFSGTVGNIETYAANALPTSGVFRSGAQIWLSNPLASTSPGWVNCQTGAAYASIRANSTAYTVGQWIRSSAGRVMECTVAGTTDTVEPTVPTVIGTTFTDGTVTWTLRHPSPAVLKAMPNLGA